MAAKIKPNRISLEEIQRILKSELPTLRKEYRVKSLGIFGSYVRGENKPKSDLDLLVEFERAPTMFGFVRLQDHLGKLLGVKVDLVMKSALKPEIAKGFIEGIDFVTFRADTKSVFAVVRALEIIGEAARHVPTAVQHKYPQVPWRQMLSMRNLLIHEYFGVDLEVLWRTVQEDLPALSVEIEKILLDEDDIQNGG